ncbi:RNase NYN domain-containing protein [Aphelenchoides fujianensis]|nr:RNase NYN domain-containing protein [Aphelenchoides fujianensis]
MERRAFVELSGVGHAARGDPIRTSRTGRPAAGSPSAAALEAQQIERVVIPWVHRVPPNLFVPPPRAVRRLIVVDGCNIGRGSCGEGREAVNCLGLLCAMRYLVLRNFDVIAFIPPSYNNDQNPFVVYPYLLPKMRSLGILGFTASRTDAHGRGPVNYDDLYVLDYAERHGGVALSGDYFEDILNDPRHPQLREVIRRRRFGIRFHRFGEAVVHVDGDIFYRCFPEVYSLAPNETHVDVQRMANRLFVTPSSNEWARAVERRSMSWSRERQLRLLDGIDEMISEVTTTANLKSYSFRTGAPGGVILCDNREEQRAIRQSARAPSTPLQFLQFPTAYPSAPERPSRPPHPQPHQQPSIVADLTHTPPVPVRPAPRASAT